MENIKEVVLEFMKSAPPGPGVNVKLYAVLKVTLKDQLELAREGRVEETDRDLVVDLESAIIEIRGTDRAPLAIDGHDFLMQQGFGIKNDRYQRTDHKGDKRRVGEKAHGASLFEVTQVISRQFPQC